jgi:DNA-binding beta-propeller fold protein YncE
MRAARVVLGRTSVAILASASVALLASNPAAAIPHTPLAVLHTYTVTGGDFHVVAVDTGTHFAYVGSGGPSVDHTEAINTRTGAITDLDVPSYSGSIAVDEATGLVYVPGYQSGDVTVLKDAAIVKTIHLATGATPYDATIDPVTGLVYVDDGHLYADGKARVTIIKGTKVVKSIPALPDPTGGAVDPTDGDVYILSPSGDSVQVFRGKKIINTVDVNTHGSTIDPKAVAVDPTRHLAYVVDQGGITIMHGSTVQHTVTDGNTLELADSIAVDPANHLAYLGNNVDSGSVTILDGPTVETTVQVGQVTGTPVYDPTNGLVMVPSGNAPQITVFQGLNVVQSLTLSPFEGSELGVDSSNGRAFISGYAADNITELQAPAPGSITIKRPTHRHYVQHTKVHVKFTCKAGVRNTMTSCTATTANGHLLATSTLGVHHFTVKLRSEYGPTITKTVSYRVKK